jgi:hypothetical protein
MLQPWTLISYIDAVTDGFQMKGRIFLSGDRREPFGGHPESCFQGLEHNLTLYLGGKNFIEVSYGGTRL